MIIFNGKEYRNLEEQVRANMEAIEEIHDIGLLLAQLGIKVVGQVDTAEELPDPTEYYADDRENHYGDAYAVGATTPYYFYLFTRPFEGETDPKWFSIGQFPLKGPKGDPGSGGGATYTSARIDLAGYEDGYVLGNLTLESNDGEQLLPLELSPLLSDGEGIEISIDSATGVSTPSLQLFKHHIIMSERRTEEGVDYDGLVIEFDVISTKARPFGTWSNFCSALSNRSPGTITLPCVGKYYESPYSGVFYSSVFVNKIVINSSTKALEAFGNSISMGDYDDPLKDWYKNYSLSQCSSMVFSDTIYLFPDLTTEAAIT